MINQLKQGYVDFSQIKLVLQEILTNQFSLINNKNFSDSAKQGFITEVNTLINKLAEIYYEVLSVIMSDKFMNSLDQIEVLNSEINLYQLRDFFRLHFYEDYFYQTEVIQQFVLEDNVLQFQRNLGFFVEKEVYFNLIDLLIQQFVEHHRNLRATVVKAVEQFKKTTSKMQLNNKYIIIGYLRELSLQLYAKIRKQLNKSQLILNNEDLILKYSSFVIEEFEVFDFSYIAIDSSFIDQERVKKQQEKGIYDFSDLHYSQIQEKLEMVTPKQSQSQCKMQEIFREDGVKGILVTIIEDKLEENNDKKKKKEQKIIQVETLYLLYKCPKMNKLILVEEKFISNKWFIPIKPKVQQQAQAGRISLNCLKKGFSNESVKEIQRQNSQKGDFLDSAISDIMKPGPSISALNDPNQFNRFQAGAASNMGQSFGYCLANINKYEDTQAFLKDFGKTAAVNGSITYMMTIIPILGPLFLLGGLGYQSLMIYNNETASSTEKLKQTGKFALQTGTGIGGSVGGAVLGQILIPVPVLGAFVGGVIGGFLGATASSQAIKLLEKNKVKNIAQNLEKLQQNSGMWVYDPVIIDTFGIKEKFFKKSQPEDFIQFPDMWTTVVTYSFIALYYGQKEQKEKQVREKDWVEQKEKKEKKFLKEYKKSDKSPDELKEDSLQFYKNLEEEEKQMMNDLDSQSWPDSIQKAQNWIISQKLDSLQYYKEIEEFVLKVLKEA